MAVPTHLKLEDVLGGDVGERECLVPAVQDNRMALGATVEMSLDDKCADIHPTGLSLSPDNAR